MQRQDQRGTRLLLEVEVEGQVARLREVLPHVGRVGAPVRRRIQTGAREEVVLDELVDAVQAGGLVVDEPLRAYGEITSAGTRSP